MKTFKLKDMTGGWFMGAFKPAAMVTKICEAAYKIHKKGERWPAHYQQKAIEVNLLIRGKMRLVINKKVQYTLGQGDIFRIEPWEVAEPHFLTDCELLVVKVPSDPGDKVVM